jgi:predicted permease
MTTFIFLKLLAIFAIVLLGWVAGRLRWLGDNDPARTLANAAFTIFVPALLFRTTARIDFRTLPWGTLAAFFVPMMSLLLVVYAVQRQRRGPAAEPSVRAISATFGNTVQVGIPVAAAMFGETGLAIHIAVMSLHALAFLVVLTALVELDLARERHLSGEQRAHLLATLATTARNTIIHPVVLPVLAGLVWNVVAPPLPAMADEILQTLSQAVVPLCLVLIGLSLAYYGSRSAARGAIGLALLKLLVSPALVLAVAHWGFGLVGLPLAVVVMMAALPVGSNALLFAQRYDSLQGETTTAIVVSTVAFALTAPVWLAILARFP